MDNVYLVARVGYSEDYHGRECDDERIDLDFDSSGFSTNIGFFTTYEAAQAHVDRMSAVAEEKFLNAMWTYETAKRKEDERRAKFEVDVDRLKTLAKEQGIRFVTPRYEGGYLRKPNRSEYGNRYVVVRAESEED